MRTKLSQFKFELNEKLIAKTPTKRRDDSRLMIVNRETGSIEHKMFSDLLDYYDEGDTLVFNNTKVFPARMYGLKEKTQAEIEVFLLRELNPQARLWDVLVDPARKIRVGNKLYFNDKKGNNKLIAEVVDNTTSRGRTIRFLYEGPNDEFRKELHALGNTPLPKVLGRDPDSRDVERYQTVFAEEIGAVAAPTAGLNFSRETLMRMELKGIKKADITLHLGLGTFRDIEVEDLSKHKMDAEYFKVNQKAVDIVNATKKDGGTVCAVGTTALRACEDSVSAERLLATNEGWTNRFIFPPYDFHIPDHLLTSFHLPKSSLFIVTCAFGGIDLILEAYAVAQKEKYKFFAYGDAMLII
ncbi:tRNA preQ1(34) S-adenosylmethionine ribosyltransferase-isomerase QueA [Neolewinella antarctica]|uniref:S-adenosylmethionine:tRNA ribosyltransferase-isomerase n=1 Tax=Neolewinella antarctica TaxID=442734 RepID=A0ABX0XGV7_9BACT|nr:tRNA preQ1(34) S-adenosylmethionine ribosyltransferase-isomerase QueA [Neolewinella antarctica]NJC28108.1 S-adenosylmethionine:tRNA ribosyltransferase-isomerase [Neolewinella antarctica]